MISMLVHLFATLNLVAQNPFNNPAPIDSGFRIGTLENGMTYYIRHNEEPKERVSFYIIQNVGALLENDDQNGLAHFLEHMAFNGTEHYPDKGIINYLEKNGVAFGRNINAYTAFNETVYNLSDVPATREGLIDSCLLVLHDWSNYLLLSEKEIDAERGVISEEWRTRRDASFRMRGKYFPVLFEGSKYAVRDVIGDLDVIKEHDYNTLRQFYHDWYRTDLQAIAIVGDIDVDEVEKKVKERFSGIPAVEDTKPRPFFEIPDHDETKFVLASDKEASNSSVMIYMKRKSVSKEEKNLNYIREDYNNALINRMIGDRINELLQKGDPPFVGGSIGLGGFVRGYDAAYISFTANPNQEAKGLEAIYTEAQRIIQHGFTASELDRAKTNMLTQMESRYKQRDKISNDQYVRGVVKHYLEAEPLTSPEFDWEFGQAALSTISVEELNKKVQEWIVPQNRVIIVQGPEEGVTHITEEEAIDVLNKVENSVIAPYQDAVQASSLIEEEPVPGKVVSTKKLEAFDAVEWTLSNNAKVVFRKADYEKDNVALNAYSLGGTSKFKTEDLETAIMMPEFLSMFGVANFDAIALNKVLTGKKASVNFNYGGLTESIDGSSTPKDFETMMQLFYLKFTQPRFDVESYNALKSRYVAYLSNMANNPQKIMQDSLSMIFNNYHERTVLITAEMFDKVSFDDMDDMYNDRFKDISGFTFFIVGNIEEDVAKAMAEKYIGSIKDEPRKETWTDHNIEVPEGKTQKIIKLPLETEKANITVSFVNNYAYGPRENLSLSILKEVLDIRYTEEVREKEGGTYGVSVRSSSSQFPEEEKTIRMNFDADPDKAEHLKAIIYREIEKIAKEGPSEEDLDKVIKNMLKEREQSKQHNRYWMNAMYNYYYHGYNPDAEDNFENILNDISTKDIRKFTKKFLKKADVVDVVFLPE